MKSEYLLALIFRLVGLFLGLQALAYIPSTLLTATVFAPGEFSFQSHILPQFFGLASSLLVAFVLLKYGRDFARRLVPPDEHIPMPAPTVGADSQAVFRLLVRAVGVLVLALAVPELVGQGFGRVTLPPMALPPSWAALAPGLVKLLIGIYFVKGAPHLVDFAYDEPDNAPEALGH